MTLEHHLENTLCRWLGLLVAANEESPLNALAAGGEGAWSFYAASGDRDLETDAASRVEILCERARSGFEGSGYYEIAVTLQVVTHVDDAALAGVSRAATHGARVQEIERALSPAARPDEVARMNAVASGLEVATFGPAEGAGLQDGRDGVHHMTQIRRAFMVVSLSAAVV